MHVEVIIPWRGGCEHRAKALGWVLRQWAPAPVTIGEDAGTGPWVKANAVTPAVLKSSADILVISDGDVWCRSVDVALAIQAVEDGAPWAVPHDRVRRLDQESTRDVLDGGFLERSVCEREHRGHAGGGMVVIRRETYLDVPLDPRFAGWGQEDDSWAIALDTIAGPHWRGGGTLWHLWHPLQPKIDDAVGSKAGQQLFHRYERRAKHPKRMRLLVNEAKKAVSV